MTEIFNILAALVRRRRRRQKKERTKRVIEVSKSLIWKL